MFRRICRNVKRKGRLIVLFLMQPEVVIVQCLVGRKVLYDIVNVKTDK